MRVLYSHFMETVAIRVLVKKSRPGLGLGLFAASRFRAGEIIAEYTGERIPTPYADTLKTRHLLEIDPEWTIDGSSRGNIARYINHSCMPNCEGREKNRRIFIHALREIGRAHV